MTIINGNIDSLTGQPVSTQSATVSTAALTATDFQTSPFAEFKTVDPYKTFDLNTLSKTQLDIDQTPNYLQGLLPADLISYLKKAPATISELSRLKMTLDQYVGMVKLKVPSSVDFTTLLRMVGLTNIASDSSRLLSTINFKSSNPISSSMFINGLLGMAGLSSIMNTSSYSSLFNTNTIFNTAAPDVVANVGSALAYSSSNVDVVNAGSTLQTLNQIGIPQPSLMVPVVNMMNSDDIKAINALVTNTPMATVVDIVNLHGAISNIPFNSFLTTVAPGSAELATVLIASNSYGTTNTNTLVSLVSEHGAVINTDITHIQTLGNASAALIIGANAAIGTAGINIIISTIAAISTPDIQAFMLEINTNGLAAYKLAHGNTGEFAELLPLMDVYGVKHITDIISLSLTTSPSAIVAFSNVIDSISLPVINKLVALTTEFPPADIITTIASFTGLNLPSLTATANIIDTVGLTNSTKLLTLLSIVPATTLLPLSFSLNTVPASVLINALSTIKGLTTNELLNITTYIDSIDPYSILTVNKPTGEILAYAVRTACKIAATVGNYALVSKLLRSYQGTITTSYRKYLVFELLRNYKTNVNDSSMGTLATAACLSQSLYSICDTWDVIDRAGSNVFSFNPWLTASADVIDILINDDKTAVAATLQKENKYKLE